MRDLGCDAVWSENDVNRPYEMFDSVMRYYINIMFPVKNIANKAYNSWITKGIKISSERKRFLYGEMCRGQVTVDFYKRYKNILKKSNNETAFNHFNYDSEQELLNQMNDYFIHNKPN
ncbi:hypothetical protein HHI36_011436, partial [Cryptolaemus montrouzieri]